MYIFTSDSADWIHLSAEMPSRGGKARKCLFIEADIGVSAGLVAGHVPNVGYVQNRLGTFEPLICAEAFCTMEMIRDMRGFGCAWEVKLWLC